MEIETIESGAMTDEERDMLLQALCEPFDNSQIKNRKGGGGKTFDYVEGQVVIDRLNAVVREWSFRITHIEDGDLIDARGEINRRVRLIGELDIPGLGARSGMGVQVMKPGAGEDLEKGALTDAIKTAARLFGVARELYKKDDERRTEWTSSATGAEPITKPQYETLKDMIDNGRVDTAEMKEKYKVESLKGLTKGQASEVIKSVIEGNPNRKAASSGGTPTPPEDDPEGRFDGYEDSF